EEGAGVAASVLIADEPGVGRGLELATVLNRRRWKAGRQHSCKAVPWKRSHTALWLGERGGIRRWAMPLAARAARKPEATYSGPLSVSTVRMGTPSLRNRRTTWATKAAVWVARTGPSTIS